MLSSSNYASVLCQAIIGLVGLLITTNLQAQTTNTDSTWQKTFEKNLKQASQLSESDQTDLSLALTLLETAAQYNAATYYEPISKFYIRSVRASSFEKNPKVLRQEAERIIPLLPDSTQKSWQTFITNKNSHLANEIVQFWDSNDPVLSSPLNERLIEHWQRITHARTHFTKNKKSPYGTDDRGTIYVRFGQPNLQFDRTITVDYASSTSIEENARFRNSRAPEFDIVIWRYLSNNTQEEHLHIFGKQKGIGTFGLRKSVLEIMNFDMQTNIVEGTNPMGPISRQRVARRVYLLGAFERLSVYDPSFSSQYAYLTTKDLKRTRVSFFEWAFEGWLSHQNKDVTNQTTTIPEYKRLNPDFSTYEFRDQEGNAEFNFAIDPGITERLHQNKRSLSFYGDSLTLNLGLEAFQKSGPKVFSQTYPSQLSSKNVSSPIMYTIKDPGQTSLVYTCEVLNPALSDMSLAPNIAGATSSSLLWASGRKKLSVPQPSINPNQFDVSDIVLADQQETTSGSRIPITPNLSHQFKENSPAMIYFEAYNVPAGGYKTTYHFEKDRFLFGPKKIDEKAEITLLSEKAEGRNSQLFSIPLQDIDPGEYTLVFEFKSLEKPDRTIKRELTIQILEDRQT